MVIAVPMVPYADQSLHSLVSHATPKVRPTELNGAPALGRNWAKPIPGAKDNLIEKAEVQLYSPGATSEKKDVVFYNKEIRLIDSKIRQLEVSCAELNLKIINCEDKVEKFKLQGELCAAEEVLLGLKYDLIKDVEELAQVKFPNHKDKRNELIQLAKEKRENYAIEEKKILKFHEYFLKENALLAQKHPKNALDSLKISRLGVESEIGIRPSYPFLENIETNIHALEQELAGIEEARSSGQWPVSGEAITPAESEELYKKSLAIDHQLQKAYADKEKGVLDQLQQESDALNVVLETLGDPYAEREKVFSRIIDNYSEHLPDGFSLTTPITDEIVNQVMTSIGTRRNELTQRIDLQTRRFEAAAAAYQMAASKEKAAQNPAAAASGGGKLGMQAVGAVFSGVQAAPGAIKKGGAWLAKGAFNLGSAAVGLFKSEVVSKEYKSNPWANTDWGKLLLANDNRLSDFEKTVQPLIDKSFELNAKIALAQDELVELTKRGADVSAQRTIIANLERDAEDLRILTQATILQRIIETMKPHYDERKEIKASVKTWSDRIAFLQEEMPKKEEEIQTLADRVVAKQDAIYQLEQRLAATDLTDQERAFTETKIAKAQEITKQFVQRQIHLAKELEAIKEELPVLARNITRAHDQITQINATLAILNAGFESQLQEYEGLNPPSRALGELLAGAVWKQFLDTITFGYKNEFYIPPEQFRLQQQKAELSYTSKLGEEKLQQVRGVNGKDAVQLKNFLQSKTTEFLAWAETHPDMAQAIVADLAISYASVSQSDVLSTLISGIRSRATVQAALGTLGRQREIAPPKLTEDDLQWVYLAEWVKNQSGSANALRAGAVGISAALTSGPLVGGLAAAGSYLYSEGTTGAVRNLATSIENKDLRVVHSVLMKVRGDTLGEIAAQEQKLDLLESFSDLKNAYLRPKGVIRGILTQISQYWTSIKVAPRDEKLLRIGVVVVPVVATAFAGGALFLGVSGVALGPLGAIGLGTAIALVPILIGGALAVSRYLLTMAHGYSAINGTWEKIKEKRIDALFEPGNPAGADIHEHLHGKRDAFIHRLHSLDAIPPTRDRLYDFHIDEVREFMATRKDEINDIAAQLARTERGGAQVKERAKDLIARSFPGPISPRTRIELEEAIQAELRVRLIPQIDLGGVKNTLITSLNTAANTKLEQLDPENRSRPTRKLHPSEVAPLYSSVLETMPEEIKALADAEMNRFEERTGQILNSRERQQMIHILCADLVSQLEKEWLKPALDAAFLQEFKVLAMRYDNEKQFAKFYDNVIAGKKDAPDMTFVPIPSNATDEEKIQAAQLQAQVITVEKTRRKLDPLVGLSSGYLSSTVDQYLYHFT